MKNNMKKLAQPRIAITNAININAVTHSSVNEKNITQTMNRVDNRCGTREDDVRRESHESTLR